MKQKMIERGKFIVLEGIDNCGKTTQSRLLKEELEKRGMQVLQTREPGGTESGEDIRKILLPRDILLHPTTQTLLFYAARSEFIQNIIKPNLEKGILVITDRFEASTYVYQGLVQGIEAKFIDNLSLEVVGKSGFKPDLYVIIDIPAQESFKRGQNEDRVGQDLVFEKQGPDFMEKLRQGYLQFAKEFTASKVVVVDGMQDIKALHKQIMGVVKELSI